MKSSTKILGLLRLLRFELPFAAGVCVVAGELLALGALPGPGPLLLGFSSVFCLSAAALILNDVFDIETDRINAPRRPLPSGQVTPRDAVWFFITISALGSVLSALIHPLALAVAVPVWGVGVIYNWRGKRMGLWGNGMVALSVGMTFIFGGIAVRQLSEFFVWYYAAIASLIDLGEEISADAMDAEGDKKAGSRSLALRLGSATALRIGAGIFLTIVILSWLPFLAGWLAWDYWVPVALLDAVLIYCTIRLLNPKEPNRRRVIRLVYLGALVSLLVLIAMRVWGY